MKKFIITLSLLPVLLFAQEQGDEMKAWMDYMTPGKMHEMLAKNSGNWTYVQETWLEPGAEPMTDKGKAKCSMIFGGRYLQMEHEGKGFGMDFNGMNIIGYDNGKGVFQSFWIDNFGTGMATAEGKWDEASKSTIMFGTMYDPVSKMDNKYRTIVRNPSDVSIVNEMYAVSPDGKEFLMMRTTYTRIK